MTDDPIFLPEQLQNWTVVRSLGRSSQGAIYEIQEKNSPCPEKAALKVLSIPQDPEEVNHLRDCGYSDRQLAELFQDRVQQITNTYGRLRSSATHQNILHWEDPVCVQQTGGPGWTVFLVTELSTPLVQAFRHNPQEDQVVLMAMDLCRVLSHCEKKQLVHGRISPRNIFSTPDGHYKLGDFGATALDAGTGNPDPTFLPPEVYHGSAPTHRSDLYALGLSMYWALNERRIPFLPAIAAESSPLAQQAAQRRLAGDPIPDPAGGSEKLKRILRKACAADPDARYASAEEMLADLNKLRISPAARRTSGKTTQQQAERNAYLHNISNRPDPVPDPVPPRDPNEIRRKLLPLLLVGLLALVLVIIFFTVHSWSDAPCGTRAVCKLCGKEQSSITNHQWRSATCTDPQICLTCGLTQGTALGHAYADATSDTPRTCTRCGATDGLPLGTEPAPDGTTSATGSGESTTPATTPGHLYDLPNTIIDLELGLDHTVALYRDGTVLAVGDNSSNQCATDQWQNIIQISSYGNHTVGLRQDGIVYATGRNNHNQCNVSSWRDISAVAAGFTHTVGLKSDGTVVAVGENRHGECNVSGWYDIVQIYAGWYNTVGVRSDGSILIAGLQGSGQSDAKNWSDVLALDTSDSHIVGLQSNGTAIAVGSDKYGQCDISGWTDLAEIHAGCAFTLGVKRDRTIVYAGITDENQEYAAEWTDICLIGVGFEHIIGIRSDGTILAVGSNDYGQCDTDVLYEHQFD